MSAGNVLPFDLSISDTLVKKISTAAGCDISAAAALLDADRRGFDLRNLAFSGIEAVRRKATSGDDDATMLLSDLASMLSEWHLADMRSEPGLTRIFSTVLDEVDDEDVFSWLDSLVSLDREGFTLEWLAKKVSASQKLSWSAVLRAADSLIQERLKAA